jgi:predicted aconitase
VTPTLTLDPAQQAMLDGRAGWPQQVAMRLLVAVARAFDAPRLIPVASVHLSLSGVSVGEPGRRLFEELVARGGRFVVPTSLNVLSLDRRTTAAGAPPPDATQLAIARACEALGGRPTYSCNPFVLGIVPAPGQTVAWNESATAPYINGVLGARTNREGATALASALTGFTAEYGMHVAAARRGAMGIQVDAPVAGADAFAVLGGAVGHACSARIPVIAGLPRTPTLDEFTAFCAALAAVSPVAMFHMIGITPEAPASLDGLGPVVRIDARALDHETARHSTATGERVHLVAVGCPHASLEQVEEVAALVGDARVADGTRFVVQTSAFIAEAAARSGAAGRLRAAGVELSADTCVHIAYAQASAGSTMATNSLKIAYLTGSHDVGVRFGTVAQCVAAGLTGRWT